MDFVFISYQRRDGEFAKRLEERLIQSGIRVWRDVNSICPAETFPQATAEAIEKCDLVILLWSKHAANSWFVNTEWNTALALHKQVCPVFVNNPIELPAALRAFNAVSGSDLDTLVRWVKGTTKKPIPFPAVHWNHRKMLVRAGVMLLSGFLIAPNLGPFPQPQSETQLGPSTSSRDTSQSVTSCPEEHNTQSTKNRAAFQAEFQVIELMDGRPKPIPNIEITVWHDGGGGKTRVKTDMNGYFTVYGASTSPKDVLFNFFPPYPYRPIAESYPPSDNPIPLLLKR